MAAKIKSIYSPFLLVFIFAAGCGSAVNLPISSSKTKVPVSVTTTSHVGEGMQTSPPTLESTPTPYKTATRTLPPLVFTPSPIIVPTLENPTVLGFSTGGYPLEIYHYGNGPIPVLFIGGIHGGYEWNTILLAYEIIDYIDLNPDIIQSQLSVYIIPSANPDGQARVIGHAGRFSGEEVLGDTIDGRFNGNGVDINRNWDCDWSPDAFWRDIKLDPGKEPFSEVETRLLRDLIIDLKPAAVIFWHSAYPAVFPGGCNDNHQPSRLLSEMYAFSADYPAMDAFTSYKVTGDSSNWLALQNIPAIEVELTNHVDTDFDRNLKGMLSVFDYIASSPPTVILIPATATTPSITPTTPDLYRVINIEQNERLNVRSGPGIEYDVIGKISWDGSGIQVTGAGVQAYNTFWVPIIYGGISGWVNSYYIAPE